MNAWLTGMHWGPPPTSVLFWKCCTWKTAAAISGQSVDIYGIVTSITFSQSRCPLLYAWVWNESGRSWGDYTLHTHCDQTLCNGRTHLCITSGGTECLPFNWLPVLNNYYKVFCKYCITLYVYFCCYVYPIAACMLIIGGYMWKWQS